MFATDIQKMLPCSLELISLSERDFTIFISSEGQVDDISVTGHVFKIMHNADIVFKFICNVFSADEMTIVLNNNL